MDHETLDGVWDGFNNMFAAVSPHESRNNSDEAKVKNRIRYTLGCLRWCANQQERPYPFQSVADVDDGARVPHAPKITHSSVAT